MLFELSLVPELDHDGSGTLVWMSRSTKADAYKPGAVVRK